MAVKLSDYRPVVFQAGITRFNIPETWDTVLSVTAEAEPGQVWEITASLGLQYDTNRRSALMRVATGGALSPEFSVEAKDNTDLRPITYTFIAQPQAAGSVTFEVQMRKEDSTGTLSMQGGQLIAKRIL